MQRQAMGVALHIVLLPFFELLHSTIDSCIARTAVMADEIAQVMQESLARRTYTMSLMAMVFLPSTFLTGLFGVNLGGIPGGEYHYGFTTFCVMLVVLIGGVAWWLHRSKWL